MNNKVCFGCGVKLQTTDKEKNGYTPKSDAVYCMRCFRLMHYGEERNVNTPKEAKEIIRKINNDANKFVIFLCDYLNISNEVIKIFKAIKNKKVLVINKCELMPKEVNQRVFQEFVKNNYKIKDDVLLKGGKTKHGAKSIYDYLNNNNIHESYILGISNSGKSTLINDLMDICGTTKNKITVSSKVNTTLDFLRVKINNELTLIDSPGFVLSKTLDVDAHNKSITAYSFNIKAGNTLKLFDGKFYLKFDRDTKIVLYTNAATSKPATKVYRAVEGLKYNLDITDKQELILIGLGYIYIKEACSISTTIPLEYLEVRNSVYGVKDE